jgi:hypothetical protein
MENLLQMVEQQGKRCRDCGLSQLREKTMDKTLSPNAAGGRNHGFEIRMNRPRAFSFQL